MAQGQVSLLNATYIHQLEGEPALEIIHQKMSDPSLSNAKLV